ncbi:MAG: glycosyltransferase 87 family protein [Planctomycetota bacterium]
MLALSGVYAVSVWAAGGMDERPSWKISAWIWVVALGARLLLFTSHPVQEDDFYRYMWDGHVCLQGVNPYRHSPDAVILERMAHSTKVHPDVVSLVRSLGDSPEAILTLNRINHPHLTTLYPPLLMAVFAAAQFLFPWNLDGLRLMLLLFDVGGHLILWKLVRMLGRPQALWVAYAWCPLVIKEFANSAHADGVVIFFILAALLAVASGRWLWAYLGLSMAVLSKIFPLILLPLLLSHGWRESKSSWRSIVLIGLGTVAAFIPMAMAMGMQSGTYAYASSWRKNSWLFPKLEELTRSMGHDHVPARFVCIGIIAVVVVVASWRTWKGAAESLFRDCFVVLGVFFCLLPAQFPWYLTWVLPFLALFPSPPWVLLSCLMPLYYLGFWVDYTHDGGASSMVSDAQHRHIVELEFLPMMGWFTWIVARKHAACIWRLAVRRCVR